MSDLEFSQKCASGDKQSWAEFIKKYSRLIYSCIYSVLNQKNPRLSQPENVSDIFQEIFILLSKDNFKKLKTFQGKNGSSLATWLRTVTVNYTIDYLRKFKDTASLDEETRDGLKLKDTIADKSESIADKLNKQSLKLHLYECIENLGSDDKYFLEFYIVKGLSLQAIKETLDISRGSVDMQKSRIIERLKNCFESKGFVLDRRNSYVY